MIWVARELLVCVATPARVLVDEANTARDSEAVIRSKGKLKEPKAHHSIAYKMRNIVDCSLNHFNDS